MTINFNSYERNILIKLLEELSSSILSRPHCADEQLTGHITFLYQALIKQEDENVALPAAQSWEMVQLWKKNSSHLCAMWYNYPEEGDDYYDNPDDLFED